MSNINSHLPLKNDWMSRKPLEMETLG